MRNGKPPKLTEIPAFNTYMGTGWGTPDRTPTVVPGAAEAAAEHRARLAEALPGTTVVLAAGEAPVRSNDTAYDFRPDSDFY
ncbi:aminopeptidase P N-terminal domain-containing protein [Streptomyces sp. NBC_00208]|nr:aminopeptidase P N-terminal domain-containing protein [Streptomyces sp. NBC_00208]